MNRRARTDRSIPANRIFDVLTMRDGYYTGRRAFWYMRNVTSEFRYTGPVPDKNLDPNPFVRLGQLARERGGQLTRR